MNISVLLRLIVVLLGFVIVSSTEEIGVYEIKKGNFSVKLTNYGARIISVVLPDKNGKLGDIALGYDSAKEYLNDSTNFGAVVGRVANRIGGAQFTLNGTHYKLIPNDGNNTLHGGPKGFAHVVWKVSKHHKRSGSSSIILTYRSHDGEQGFPGDLRVWVSYSILANNQLSVVMKAKALNKATPVNLAQHTYWNLGGHNSGNILSNDLQIFASHITPVDSQLIPTGKFTPVKGTPYDFLQSHSIASTIKGLPSGYDINYVLDASKERRKLKKAAVVQHKQSGRVMELFTNAPGVQFYTGNFLKDVKGKGGFVYQRYGALCLETQGFPDAVNHPNFPSQIITPGKHYAHYMLFKFSTSSAFVSS